MESSCFVEYPFMEWNYRRDELVIKRPGGSIMMEYFQRNCACLVGIHCTRKLFVGLSQYESNNS